MLSAILEATRSGRPRRLLYVAARFVLVPVRTPGPWRNRPGLRDSPVL